LDPPLAFLAIGTIYLVYATFAYCFVKLRRGSKKDTHSAD
ncbi:MAG: hypothetical protein ACI9WC_002282, partial [Arenicella sp.]